VASIDKTVSVAELAAQLKTELNHALAQQASQAERWKV